MMVSRIPPSDAVEEWLSVKEASVLLGVAPATLRRWSVTGDVQAFTTPGGHRRFARSTILELLPSTRRARPTLARFGATPEHMTHIYRRHLEQACRGSNWLAEIREEELVLLHHHGRRITVSLLEFIDATNPPDRQRALRDALSAITEFGRIAARGSAEIGETIENFLRFRALFIGELAQLARRHSLDTFEATDLLVTATQGFDQLLVALMSSYEIELAETRGELG